MFSLLLMSSVFLGSVKKKNAFLLKSFSGEGRGKVEF